MAAPFKRVLVADAETAWDSKEYTLSKMTTEEYIRDPRFKTWGFCFKWLGDPGKARWVGASHLPEYLARIDWSTTALLAQNTMFDGAILNWRYGVKPCFYFDTLSMGRAVRGVERGNSLAKMAEDYGLPAKGRAVHSTDGMLDTLTHEIERELAEYCKHDVFLCEEIFKRLVMLERGDCGQEYPLADMSAWKYPIKELRLIDMTLRMFVEPKIELDADMLTDALHEEKETREALLNRLNITDGILASTPQFAELLRSIGVEPPLKKNPKGEMIPALAKNDALFQAMLNGEDENLALLCEARLKVKSTTERTRAQRFLDISARGPLPVPLSYYGALSGRWTAARGSAINMQNLKRGSFLRKALLAPWGYEFGVVDLSQIEPRTLAWTSDYEDLMNVFRAGDDPYAVFGRTMFNMPELTKVSSPVHRQAAKSAMLGCFGPDTLVLTARGWTPIVSVQATDTVWDGEEWVQHGGVLAQGEKEVLTALGVSATSDHEILTARGWVAWSAVLQNRSLLQSALSLANSHALGGSDTPGVLYGRESTCISQGCAARAGGRVSWSAPTSAGVEPHGATRAQKLKRFAREWRLRGMSESALIAHTGIDCSTGSAPSSFAAPTQKVRSTLTTAGAVLAFISRGLRTVSSFCATLLGSMDGIVRSFSSIEQTTVAATSPAIFASSRAVSTCPTSVGSQQESSKRSNSESHFSRQRMQTYDVSFAGPRSRFTIWSAEGPLIVHNCGYQLGWASFAAQLLVGFLGAPPVRYGKEFAKQLGIDRSYIERFLDYTPNVLAMGEIPHSCTGQELLVHCVVAHKIIALYRAAAYPVVGLWKRYEQLIPSALADGEEAWVKCFLFRKEEIVLPNGMSLLYPNLRQEKDDEGKKQWVYGTNATKLYPGKVCNNTNQALARIVMTDGLLRIDKRYRVVGSVHDEGLMMLPENEADEGLKWCIEQMTIEPKYLPGIPLAADGGWHKRYGLAKN